MGPEAIACRFTLKTAAGCRVALPQQLGQNFKTLGSARAIANGKGPHLIPVGPFDEVNDGQLFPLKELVFSLRNDRLDQFRMRGIALVRCSGEFLLGYSLLS